MFKSKINLAIKDFATSNYELIKVKPGMCRYNYMCHANAVHDALTLNHTKIAMCIYFEDNVPCIHFINYYPIGGFFMDNTLGEWSRNMEYYLVRFINDDEFFDVFKIHKSFRKLIKRSLPWHLKPFHHLKDI